MQKPNSFLQAFGQAIRAERRRRNLTIAEFSEHVGYGKSMISQVEHGINATSLEKAIQIALYLQIDLTKLIRLKPTQECPTCHGKGKISTH